MKVEIKNGSMYTVNPAGASPMSSFATGYAASPPRMPVPSASAAQVGASLPVKRKISPQHRAPTMLPGKASRLPMPSRLRIRLAQNAIPTPHHGPRMTAENTLTICWTGAHLLPATGTLIRLPATAAAVRTPAMASFWVDVVS